MVYLTLHIAIGVSHAIAGYIAFSRHVHLNPDVEKLATTTFGNLNWAIQLYPIISLIWLFVTLRLRSSLIRFAAADLVLCALQLGILAVVGFVNA